MPKRKRQKASPSSKSKPGPKGPPPLKIEGNTLRAFSHFLGAAQRKKQIKMVIEARLGKRPKR